MRFATYSALFVSGLASAAASAEKRDTSSAPFDIYDGPTEQDTLYNDPASKLEYTLSGGQPYPNPLYSDRLGTTGPLLLQSTNLIEQLAHFVRERVPERTVHAKGGGAHGYFEVTTDTGANYSMADLFSTVGKRTPLTARFSTIAGNLGNADSVRDLRGAAFKMRTDEGILDWVFLNHPVFWLRDPVKFPHFIRSQKREPQTNLLNKNNFWDYLSGNNESIYQVMRTMSDLGTPYGFRHMNAWSGNTFRAIKADGSWVYIKISAYTDQGVKNNTEAEAVLQAGQNPDFGVQDLFDSIEAGDFPSWTVYFQTMTPAQAEAYKYNVFDLTKEWLVDEVPLQEIGRIVLNQNPTNYFAEIEQLGFDPSQMPNGLDSSVDPTLQARLFAYGDAQRYRIGVNHKQLPINCPLNPTANFLRDGFMNFNNQGKRPNFVSQQDPLNVEQNPYPNENHTVWTGTALKYLSTPSEIDFDLPRIFWNGLSATDQANLISNVIGHLGLASDQSIKDKQCAIFNHVNATLGQAIAKGVNCTISS
ncbi:hypothetical protein SERLA73DRAFT_161314 [Serpula lacrymans var. lacrymans S7.3]|uniref:Catalase n=2 Tax=Serpula lacrymans var. lacrymans TaxID=341189 RepID=F8Q3M8_SERL3|nr:uncharacterized protein SERLADRAFT_471060 [Serpula lacrymans var. lacrymans S7.9]EGN97113.1 hypothetical protein SERLA73DRAFT_161314 [Serpula lacrymans var. lacrymans S7.3]EGO22719.1 hypothetical protein SERLADRAFT_471060 [Serpula lacrymans var. lacrymans S7.9]